MAEFLVEVYLRHDDPHGARLHTGRVEQAAIDLDPPGLRVRCTRSLFVPEDETLLLHFRATSAEAVDEAVRHAGLRCEHISAAEAIDVTGSSPAGPLPSRKAPQ